MTQNAPTPAATSAPVDRPRFCSRKRTTEVNARWMTKSTVNADTIRQAVGDG